MSNKIEHKQKCQSFVRRTDSAHGPFCFDTSSREIARDLKQLTKTLKNMRSNSQVCFPSFKPADGIVTVERIDKWQEERRMRELRQQWTQLQGQILQNADTSPPERPQFCVTGETDRAYEFRCKYYECRNNGFEKNPWKAMRAPKDRWETDAIIKIHGRSRWNWEMALAKEYRKAERWAHIDFDERLDFAPEEVMSHGEISQSPSWRRTRPLSSRVENRTQSDTGCQGGKKDDVGEEDGILCKIPSILDTSPSELCEIYLRGIEEGTRHHRIHIPRHIIDTFEGLKQRLQRMAMKRKIIGNRPWSSV